jgi:hypothetical protein
VGPVRWFRILIDPLSTLIDLVFGYDYFISYSHSDGANYPTKLADRLETFGSAGVQTLVGSWSALFESSGALR